MNRNMNGRHCKWLILIVIALAAFSLGGCDGIEDLFHPDHDKEEEKEEKKEEGYALGSAGPGGGKIFYISTAGFTDISTNKTCHYLEVSPTEIGGSLLSWASPAHYPPNAYLNIPGAAGTAIGTGAANTAAILAADPAAPAALACKNYSGGGKTDWFLPSKDELQVLFDNLTASGLDWSISVFWSSSQTSAAGAWLQYMVMGEPSNGNKSSELPVCAVRAF